MSAVGNGTIGHEQPWRLNECAWSSLWLYLQRLCARAPGTGQTQAPAPILAELRVGGDDGLTQRFADAIRRAIEFSEDFALPRAHQGQLIMTIPTHLSWQEDQGKLNFEYLVLFTDRDSRNLGTSTGTCGESDMETCSASVVSDARAAWAAK